MMAVQNVGMVLDPELGVLWDDPFWFTSRLERLEELLPRQQELTDALAKSVLKSGLPKSPPASEGCLCRCHSNDAHEAKLLIETFKHCQEWKLFCEEVNLDEWIERYVSGPLARWRFLDVIA